MNPGLIGAIVGCVVGFAGGVIGTYFGIKNTKGPKERAFMVKASIVIWLLGGAFLALLFFLPNPYRFLVWIPYGIILPLGIFFGNKRLAQIRTEESKPA